MTATSDRDRLKSTKARLRNGIPVHIPPTKLGDGVRDAWIYAESGGICVCLDIASQSVRVRVITIPLAMVRKALAAIKQETPQ